MAMRVWKESDTMHNTLALPSGQPTDWDGALLAFLAEKERRSGSRRTSVGYSRMLFHFFGIAGKPPDQGHQPGSVRLGLRSRPLRQGAVGDDDRRAHCVSQLVLPLLDPDEGD